MNCQRPIVFATLAVLLSLPADAQTHRTDIDSRTIVTGFGASIVMSGNEVYVGRPGEMSMFPMPASRAGGVHIFEIGNGSVWSEVGMIGAPDGVPGDGFGTSIAISADLLAVGAPKHNGGRGAVHLFLRSSGSWEHVAMFANVGGGSTDGLGQAVAIAGDRVLVGMPGQSDGTGAVLVLERSGAGLSEVSRLMALSGEANDRFGSSLAIDGDRVIVGAPGPSGISILGPAGPPKAGAAYVFTKGSGAETWEQQTVLRSAERGVVALGHAVGFAGDVLVATAPLSGGGAGGVHLFERDASGAWAESNMLRPEPATPGSLFGFALATNNDVMLVGAPLPSGAVFSFKRDDTTGVWAEHQQLSASLTGMVVFQGGAIALEANRAVIGAPGADFFQGAGVLFERDAAGDWNEQAKLLDDLPGFDAVAGGQVDCEEGTATMFNCDAVDLVAFIPVKELGAERGITVNDVWGWTDSLTGRDYAIVGRSDGTTFIDVSDAENPRYLGVLPLTEGAIINIWRDIKVYKNHAFIVADASGAHGVQIFDLTQLRDLRDTPVTFEESAHYSGIFSAHNIVINERTGFAYAVGSSGGGETCGGALHMIDVREPTEPKFAGCFSDPTTGNASTGYSHDAQCVTYHGPDVDYAGREICFGSNETALSIADVTDKENPTADFIGELPQRCLCTPRVGYRRPSAISS